MAENDAGILANAAFVLAHFGEDIGAMVGLVDRALALNPSFARGWYLSGLLRLYAGNRDLAIDHVETSLRLSPRERVGPALQVIGIAYFLKRQFDEDQTSAFFFWEKSSVMRGIAAMITRVADSDVTVLIRGESGVGKELVARAIHDRSVRRQKPFVKGPP